MLKSCSDWDISSLLTQCIFEVAITNVTLCNMCGRAESGPSPLAPGPAWWDFLGKGQSFASRSAVCIASTVATNAVS